MVIPPQPAMPQEFAVDPQRQEGGRKRGQEPDGEVDLGPIILVGEYEIAREATGGIGRCYRVIREALEAWHPRRVEL
jgi:hypothetical protein